MSEVREEIRIKEMNICDDLEKIVFQVERLSTLSKEISDIFLHLKEDEEEDFIETQGKCLERDEKIALWRYYFSSIASKNEVIDLKIQDWEIMTRKINE